MDEGEPFSPSQEKPPPRPSLDSGRLQAERGRGAAGWGDAQGRQGCVGAQVQPGLCQCAAQRNMFEQRRVRGEHRSCAACLRSQNGSYIVKRPPHLWHVTELCKGR